jgi:hypothetical protein
VEIGYAWNVISDYVTIPGNITAGTIVSGSVIITATGTATNVTPEANRLVLQAGVGTASQPTLTFTTLKIEKTGSGTTAPSAPSNVTATPVDGGIRITWSAVSGATSYDVYYGINTYPFNFAGNATSTSFTHTGLNASTTYYYCVRAKNSVGESDDSSYTYATTLSSGGGGNIIDLYGDYSFNENYLNSGETHYYRFFFFFCTVYVFALDSDNSYNDYSADITFSVKREGSSWYEAMYIDSGEFEFYVSSSGYFIIEVQGYSTSSYGSYAIGHAIEDY